MGHRAHRIRSLSALISAAMVSALLTAQAFALDPQKAITQFTHRSWGAPDGFSSVCSIAQTMDGYIWIGTAKGILRFDGAHFTRLEPGTNEPAFRQEQFGLLGSRDGSLWCCRRGCVVRRKDGLVKIYGPKDGLPGGNGQICEDHDGGIWIGTDSGLAKFSSEKWQVIGPKDGLPQGSIQAVLVDHENTIWVIVAGSRPDTAYKLAYLRKGEMRVQLAGDAEQQTPLMAEAPDGKIWMAQIQRSVRAVAPVMAGMQFLHPEIQVGSQGILFDRDGTLWITTVGDGLRRVRNTTTLGTNDIGEFSKAVDQYTQRDGLSSDVNFSAFEDREGSVWVCTLNGLDCFSETKVTSISVREGLPFDQNLRLQASSDGSVWAGGSPGGFEQIKDGGKQFLDWKWFNMKPLAVIGKDAIKRVYSFYADPSGDLLLGTGLGVGVMKKGTTEVVGVPGAAQLRTVYAMTRDHFGVLWLCDAQTGVSRVEGEKSVKMPTHLSRDIPYAIHTDATGRVWMGFESGSLACYEGGQFTWFSAKDGLFPGAVMDILSDAKGQIWISGSGGISRFANGRFQTLTRRNGLPDDSLFGVIQDQEGFFWLGGWFGLFRVSSNELESAFSSASGQVTGEVFDLNDGLLGPVQWNFQVEGKSASTISPDGRLWFATGKGLAIINPRHIPRNLLPPPVHVEKIVVARKDYEAFENQQFPIGTRDCEIDYAGLSFVNPMKVRYKYKLEGYDEDWVEAGTRRQAFYSNLKPKKYKFTVLACNNDGVWNQTGDTVAFSILPAFYETRLFPPLCALSVVLALWGLYRLRLARITGRMKLQLDGQIKERKRIAQELHDTLLQGFTGIGLKLDAITSKLPDSLKTTKEQLQRILEQSDQYLTEARRSVWELRSMHLEKTDDFAGALSDSCAVRLEGTGIQLDFSVDGERRKLAPLVEDNLLRICEEAVTNAVKHARPTQVQVNLGFRIAGVRLRIWDNGCGFDPKSPEATKTGHFGLVGMQERVKSMAGTFSVNSHPGKQTEIIITVAVNPAGGEIPLQVSS